MTLSDIVKKLIIRNKERYLLFGISICFSVSMIGAYGALLFSETITGVLMTDGSTYIISTGMYGITIVGVLAFLFYANGIYLQSLRKETGIYMSLGLKPKVVAKMQNRQFDFCFLLGSLAGILLAIPISYMAWKLITVFFVYTAKVYTVGWKGLCIAFILAIFSWVLLRAKNYLDLSGMDVITVLKSDITGETVKGSSPVLGVIGLIAIPFGIIMFNITAVTDGLKKISTVFLGVSLAGIYLVAAQVTSVGRIVKRISHANYMKNLLFFNLVRQKGGQYTLALFVSSILIAITVFAICFNGSSFLESYYRVNEEPYDFAVLYQKDKKGFDETQVRKTAENNGIRITDWHTLHLLLLGREYQYQDSDGNEWSSDFAISVSEFNKLSGENLTLPDNGYALFQDSEDAMFRTCSEEAGHFYNPVSKEEFFLHKEKLLTKEDVLNNSAQIDTLLILSDTTFERISETMDDAYKFEYFLFNGTGLDNSAAFQKELLDKIVKACNGKMVMNMDQISVKDKLENYREEILPYEDNKLEAARYWLLYPYAKHTQSGILMEYGAVYLLLIFFIALITFVSATMIIALKVAGTISQDIKNYRKAVNLGLKDKDLKHLVRRQMKLIFFFPAICGCTTAVIMINRFLSVSSIQHFYEVTIIAVILSIIVFIIQVLIFVSIQKRLVNSVMKKVAING